MAAWTRTKVQFRGFAWPTLSQQTRPPNKHPLYDPSRTQHPINHHLSLRLRSVRNLRRHPNLIDISIDSQVHTKQACKVEEAKCAKVECINWRTESIKVILGNKNVVTKRSYSSHCFSVVLENKKRKFCGYSSSHTKRSLVRQLSIGLLLLLHIISGLVQILIPMPKIKHCCWF